jgi:hypothetical protein
MVQDFAAAAMGNWVKNRRGGGGVKGHPRYKFPWKSGRNNLRLLPFTHRVTELDVAREGKTSLGITPDMVGNVYSFLFVPVVRFFDRGDGGRGLMNGLGIYDCPLASAFFAKVANAPKPTDGFVCNVVDMDKPELGVLQYVFKRSEWLGPHEGKIKVGYGIADIIFGYDPNAETKQGEGKEDGDEAPKSKKSILDAIDGFGNVAYGTSARDISIWKTNKMIGGRPALCIDTEVDSGGILLRGPKASNRLDPEVFGQDLTKGVVDLLADPQFYPGWAKDGDHLSEEANEFVLQFGDERNRKQLTAGEEVQDEEEDEVLGSKKKALEEVEEETVEETVETEPEEETVEEEAPEEEVKPQPKKKGKKKKAELEVGDRVTFKNDGTSYVGELLKFDSEEAHVGLVAEEQPTEEAKADVEDLTSDGSEYAVVEWKTIRVA